jgi:hypothetical protein
MPFQARAGRIHKDTAPTEIWVRLPVGSSDDEEVTGSPRLLGRPLRTCRDRPPRRLPRLLALVNGGDAAVFGSYQTLD